MMLNRIGLLSILVFLLTCSFAINSSDAYPDWEGATEAEKQEYRDIEGKLDELEVDLDKIQDLYEHPHSALAALNHHWNNDMAKIADGKKVIFDSAISAIISSIAAGLAPSTGGISIAGVVLANLNIVKNGLDATVAAGEILSVNKGEYFTAYSKIFEAISEIDTGLDTYYAKYLSAYEKYLTIMLDHHTGLVQLDLTGDTPIDIPYNSDEFFKAVNGFSKTEAWTVESSISGTTTGWYHSPGGSHSGVGQNHRVTTIYHRYYYNDPLPKTHRCQNENCKHNATFSTPYEAFVTHGTRCEGCGDVYYSCDTDEIYANALERHKLRDCNLKIWQDTTHGPVALDCPNQYRYCDLNWNTHIHGFSFCMEVPFDAVPSMPLNLSLTPGVTTIQFTWRAPVYSGSSEITDYKYKYRRKTLGIDPWSSWISAGTDFSETITGLAADTQYAVELQAKNSVGNSVSTSNSTRTNTDSGTASASPGLHAPSDADTIMIGRDEMLDTQPGDTVTLNLVMPSDRGYAKIHWYLSDNELGDPTKSSGTDIETEVTHTFSMPSDASGVYTFKAYIYPHSSASNQDVYEYTIKIYCS